MHLLGYLCLAVLHSCYLPCRLILYRYVACFTLYLGGFYVHFKIHFENPYKHICKLCGNEENMTLFMVLATYIPYSAKFWQRHQQTEGKCCRHNQHTLFPTHRSKEKSRICTYVHCMSPS